MSLRTNRGRARAREPGTPQFANTPPNDGWYASRTRGIRRRAGTEGQQTVYAAFVPVPLREARRRWAELLRRIFEVEPLECPRCGQAMRIVAFITEPQVPAVTFASHST